METSWFTRSLACPHALGEFEAEAVAYLCADALGLGGAAECRGYIQHFLAQGARLDEPPRAASRRLRIRFRAGREPLPAPALAA